MKDLEERCEHKVLVKIEGNNGYCPSCDIVEEIDSRYIKAKGMNETFYKNKNE